MASWRPSRAPAAAAAGSDRPNTGRVAASSRRTRLGGLPLEKWPLTSTALVNSLPPALA